MAFAGFPSETLAFLAGINANNTKDWFTANRPLYDATVAASKAFVETVGPQLRKIAPEIQFEPKVGGSLQRPNRDTRLDKGKPPYKEQLDLWFWHGEKRGWDQPGFFLRIAPDNLWIASGMMHILWPQLKTFRAAVLDDRSGSALVATVDSINAIGPYQVGYPKRKSVPKGFDADHPRAEYLKYESLWGHLQLSATAAIAPDFADVALTAWRDLAPLTFWLRDEVTATPATES
jgi:uncharacterized protein (TIGR02453 family)